MAKFHNVFTDYLLADMPAIPATWKDISWGNDACPSFQASGNDENGLIVFVDYKNESDRELPESTRYSIVSTIDGENNYPLDSDNWQDILAYVANNANKGN